MIVGTDNKGDTPALKLSTCHHQTYGFWLSWDPTCGSPPAASAAAPESCRTSWTPSPPPSRCPGRCRWHVEKGPRVGVLCWWACDSRPRPGTKTTRVSSACVSRCPPPASCHPSPTTYSHASARCSSDERACLFQTINSGGTRETVGENTHTTPYVFKTNPRRIAFQWWIQSARRCDPPIPPYFLFFKARGTLCCCTLETLPPKVYSNSTRQSAAWREKRRKKHEEKSGKVQIKTRRIL